jgi:hypothetical protein
MAAALTGATALKLALLAALDHYGVTWHSLGFLVGKGLIDPGWTPAGFYQVADDLAAEGLVAARYSRDRQQMMYRITLAGQSRLRHERPA